MADTIKSRLLTSLQHSFCCAHYNLFLTEHWKELSVMAKYMESVDRPDLANSLLAIFPEAPEVTTLELWERLSHLVNTEILLPYDLCLTAKMIERVKNVFRCCSYCRIGSARQVVLLDDERAALTEATEKVDRLENQVFFLREEIYNASKKKKRYETTMELLQQEVRRLQFILSKSKIPVKAKNSYGALYRHLFEAEEVPEISTLLRGLLDGEVRSVNPKPRRR